MIRADCECVDWPKPCQYHEGWSDGFDEMKDYAEAMENAWHDCSHAVDPLRELLTTLVHRCGQYIECDERPRTVESWRMMCEAQANAAVYLNTGEWPS